MHTRNTVTQQKNSRLSNAIFIFNTLGDESSKVLIKHLRDHGNASLLDLSIQSGFDPQHVEMHLEQLCLTGVVVRKDSIAGCRYHLDLSRLASVKTIAREIAQLYRE